MSVSRLLSKKFLSELHKVSFLIRGNSHGHLRGQHRSNRNGSGMVFSDFRPYYQGDDLKNIDWNIFLKSEKLVLKLFEEEVDLPIYIFLDISSSMNFGIPKKIEIAKKISAILSYVAISNHDRVSLILFSDHIKKIIPLNNGKNQIWKILKALDDTKIFKETTNFLTSINSFFNTRKVKGYVILISDFMINNYDNAFKIIEKNKHKLIAIQLVGNELDEMSLGENVLIDSETGKQIDVNLSSKKVNDYKKFFLSHCNEIERFLKKKNFKYVKVENPFDLRKFTLNFLRFKGILK